MFKLCSEEYFQTKLVLNFAWECTANDDAPGLMASFVVSPMRTKPCWSELTCRCKCLSLHSWELGEKRVLLLCFHMDYTKQSHARTPAASSRATPAHPTPKGSYRCSSSAFSTPFAASCAHPGYVGYIYLSIRVTSGASITGNDGKHQIYLQDGLLQKCILFFS